MKPVEGRDFTIETLPPIAVIGSRADPIARPVIAATPFVWKPPAQIPLREWIYARHYIRKYISVTIAPGGVGKSSLTNTEALAIVTGRPFLDIVPDQRGRVWMWNGEDPLEEIERRITAAMLHFGIDASEVESRLFLNSGRSTEIKLATMEKTSAVIAVPVFDAIVATIQANQIDVLVIDPFVSSHGVSENDNGAIDAVAKAWARIADTTNCSIELVHHARKTNGAEVTVEDGRGAVALISAARATRALNTMTEDEAAKAGDIIENRRLYFRADDGKSNLSIPSDRSDWYRLQSVSLGNGTHDGVVDHSDHVGVVTKWNWPNAFDGISVADLAKVQAAFGTSKHRESAQSTDWAGRVVADALDLDADDKADRERIKTMLKAWIKNDALRIIDGFDDKRMARRFIAVGQQSGATP